MDVSYRKAFNTIAEHLPGWKFDYELLTKIGSKLDNMSDDEIYPKPEEVLRCFYNLSPIDIKVVIIGQDCYHTPHVANGLAFSCNGKLQPSLQNIFKELKNDLDIENTNGSLYPWKKQGVLLLNTSLTVERGKPGSHMDLWDGFTENIIEMLLERDDEPRAYILWGKFAQDVFDNANPSGIFSNPNYLSLRSPHPSPYSADRGFFGSKPFSKTNEYLKQNNIEPIDWRT